MHGNFLFYLLLLYFRCFDVVLETKSTAFEIWSLLTRLR